MRKRAWIFGCLLLALLNMHAQSAWRILPERIYCTKKLHNTFTTSYYNHELEVERINVENNKVLLLQLKCPSHSLEYRSEVNVSKNNHVNWYEEYISIKPEDSLFFFPGEDVQIRFDLSPFQQNGEYCFEFKFHTELKETFYFSVYLNTEEFEEPRGVEMRTYYPDYEKLQEDENHVYSWIEHNAEFPGGNKGLVRFLKENIQMGELPEKSYMSSNVTVGMIIDKDGSILYPEILRSHWEEFNAEAMRLVNIMPKWKPGSIDGVKVKNRVMVKIYYYKNMEESCMLFDSYVLK